MTTPSGGRLFFGVVDARADRDAATPVAPASPVGLEGVGLEGVGLEGVGLACRRGGRLVFRGLSFCIRPGDALVITGPNGSGKSSLLRLMAGLIAPHAGRLTWDGEPVADCADTYRRAIAYVGHLDAVKPVLTARDNLRFWASLSRGGAIPSGNGPDCGTEARTEARIDGALGAFGLADLADLPGRYLSAGQRRRLALARLVTGHARLWLLDEPTVALDSSGIKLLERAIAGHRAGAGAVALATHACPEIDAPVRLDLAAFLSRPGDDAWADL